MIPSQRTLCLVVASALFGVSATVSAEDPFAAVVIDFDPAPGQFVNMPEFNGATRALGPPVGGGTADAGLSSIVSLGGFGGSITLGFDHTVLDDALNPLGMDAIIFGNAVWVGGDPDRHFAECGVIEIALDENGNGVADDQWYLIPGSHITDIAGQFTQQTWDDDIGDPTNPPANASWIPPGQSGVWTTEAYLLPPGVFAPPPPPFQVVVNPQAGTGNEGIYGYADYSPTLILGDLDGDNLLDDPLLTPEEFYVRPDDPMSVGVSPGSGGGDAFDIAWAIDPVTGEPANLPGFDFIRITNGVNAIQGPVGEVSPEIDAVADVAPMIGGDLVPAASSWGVAILAQLVLIVGTMLFGASRGGVSVHSTRRSMR